MAKSAIWKVSCARCTVCFGQTIREVKTCFGKHLKGAESAGKKESTHFTSKVLEHIVLTSHTNSNEDANSVKPIRKLDVSKSMTTYRIHKDALFSRD